MKNFKYNAKNIKGILDIVALIIYLIYIMLCAFSNSELSYTQVFLESWKAHVVLLCYICLTGMFGFLVDR